jgi:hypothetical protein
MKTIAVFAILLTFLFAPTLKATDIVDVHIVDQEVTASITVADIYHINLTITFENALGLTENSISITAGQINPLDLNLLRRFTDSSLISVPGQLPVMVTIGPTAGSSLSFTGVADVEFSTSNLTYASQFRLYKAPVGGTFEDITNFSGVGSYRVRGTSGDFSDFLIVADVRSASVVINDKFAKLQTTLTTNASKIEAATYQNLQTKLDTAKAKYQAGLKPDAIAQLQSMTTDIKSADGSKIPNIYRANDTTIKNVSGILQGQAATLIFSLGL